MGEFTDQVSAAGNKIVGKAKEVIGNAIDDEQLKTEGEAQQIKSMGQGVKGRVKGALGDKV